MHWLAGIVWYRVCCYSNNECLYNHCLPQRAKTAKAQHVPGNQPGSCRHVCWGICVVLSFEWFRKLLPLVEDQLIASRSQHIIRYREILCRCLSDKPSRHFTGAHARHLSSNQTSSHQQVDLWSSCWIRLVHCLSVNGGGLAWFHKIFQSILFLVVLLSCCLFIIFASYTAVVVKMYCGSPPQHHGAVNRERKLTKTLLMVTTISLLLSLPHIIFFFRSFLNVSSVPTNLSYRSSLPRHLNFVLFFLYHANSLANPILYALRLPELRRALLTCLRCRCQSVRVFPHHPWWVAGFSLTIPGAGCSKYG